MSLFRLIGFAALTIVAVMPVNRLLDRKQEPTGSKVEEARPSQTLASPKGQTRFLPERAKDVKNKSSADNGLALTDDRKLRLPSEAQQEIELRNGRLSVHVADRSLVSILEQISIQSGVSIIVKDRQMVDRPVTADFEATPLDGGLRNLLSDEDILMLFSADGQVPPDLKAVVVYPNGQGDSIAFSDLGENVGDTEQLAQSLGSFDETERAEAIQTLVGRLGTKSQDLVLQALTDESDQVREQALYAALESALTLPVDTLVNLAKNDPLPSVRMYALEALASNLEGPDSLERLETIAEAAEGELETHVREHATRLFKQMTNEPAPPNRQQRPENK